MSFRPKASVVPILAVCILSCSLFPDSEITQEQVIEAVGISYEAQLKFGIPSIMGKETEGVQFDKKNNIFTYSNCDLAALYDPEAAEDEKYTRMSGKVELLQNRLMVFDVVLTGGPVKSLKYEVDLKVIKKLESSKSKSYQIEVEANGKTYTVDLVETVQRK